MENKTLKEILESNEFRKLEQNSRDRIAWLLREIPSRYRYVDPSDDIVNKKQPGKGLYIYGSVGSGKTYEAYGLLNRLIKNVTIALIEDKVKYYELPNIASINHYELEKLGTMRITTEQTLEDNFKDKLNNTVLLFDDIGATRATEYALENIYWFINELYNRERNVIFTSNYTLAELAERLDDRIASRIAEMTIPHRLTGKDKRI